MGDDIGQTTKWFYNLTTGQVEPEGQSKAKDLLGPYPDPESAARALESLHAREERLEAEDREWSGTDES